MPKQIETAPMMFNKERVTVRKDDLEQLEKRAKLSLTHEKATKQLVMDSKDTLSQAMQQQRSAEERLKMAEQEHRKAVEMRKMYEQKYQEQVQINTTCEELKAQIVVKDYRIRELQTENTSLRGQIADLRQTIEQRVQKAVEPLKEQIQAFKDKIEGMSKGQLTLMRSMRYVRDMFSGEVGGAVLNATLKTGNRFFEEDGFEELSKDRESTLPRSVAKEVQLKLDFRKGEEGLGVYTEKGTCLVNCKTFREAKELLPNCSINNRAQDRGLVR